MTPSQPAAPSFFTNRSTQAIAQDLLGTHLLYTSHQGTLGGQKPMSVPMTLPRMLTMGAAPLLASRSIMNLVRFIFINYAVSFYLIS